MGTLKWELIVTLILMRLYIFDTAMMQCNVCKIKIYDLVERNYPSIIQKKCEIVMNEMKCLYFGNDNFLVFCWFCCMFHALSLQNYYHFAPFFSIVLILIVICLAIWH